MSSFSDRDDKEIDEYRDESNSSKGSSSSKSSSSEKVYSSGTLGIPLEVFQVEMRKRAASRFFAGPFTAPSAPIPSLAHPTDNI